MTIRHSAIAVGVLVIVAFVGNEVFERRFATPEHAFERELRSQANRPLQVRLTGDSPAPWRSSRGTDSSAERMRLVAAATAVLGDEKAETTPENLRLEGVAALLIGDLNRAERVLRKAVESGDARARADYAAAFLVRADSEDDVRWALDAAAEARRVPGDGAASHAARFNYALALERLGLIDSARRAFDEVSRNDPDTHWRSEAQRHLAALPAENEKERWKQERESFVRTTSLPNAVRLVGAFPQESRVFGESVDLSEWAEASRKNDNSLARAALRRAALVGRALHEQSGEALLADSVAAIESAEASGNGERLGNLVDGHVLYKEGRLAYRDGKPGEGEQKLRNAALAFRAGRSPMEFVARYYISSTLYDQNRISDVLNELDALSMMKLEERGYRALSAQTGWERGLCLLTRGSYSRALNVFKHSRSELARLGELDLTASFDGFIAETLDYIGDARAAWQARARALAGLYRTRNQHRMGVVLSAAAQSHTRLEEWRRAEILLDAVINDASGGRAVVLTHALTDRSVARDYLGDLSGSEKDRSAAAGHLATIEDTSYRARAEAELALALGLSLKKRDLHRAIDHATRALDYFAREQPSHLPRIYLERGRLQLTQTNLDAAQKDFDAGLEIIEKARRAIDDYNLRALTSQWAAALYVEAITAARLQGDLDRAFLLAERARARALLERLGEVTREEMPMTAPEISSTLAEKSAIVEYAESSRGILAFVLRKSGMQVVALPASRAAIQTAVADNQRNPEAAARVLREYLIDPIRDSLRDIDHVAFVPMGFMANVSFGALLENGGIIRAPSATLAVLASQRARQLSAGDLLVVGGDAFSRHEHPDLASLEGVPVEVRNVTALRRHANILVSNEATRGNVLSELPRAGIVHFAGHIDGFGRDARLVLAGRDSLTTEDIAAMKLLGIVVVLSACRGSQPSVANDGVADVATAFLAAGASSVIATTEALDDRTAASLMPRIHQAMLQTDAVVDAMRTVSRESNLSSEERMALSSMVVLGGSRGFLRDDQR